MKPLVDQFDSAVTIAREPMMIDRETGQFDTDDISLLTDGSFYAQTQEANFTEITKISPGAFLTSKEILSNLVDALAKSMAQRKETIREVEMARRIVDAIATSLQTKAPSGMRRGKKKHTKSKSRAT